MAELELTIPLKSTPCKVGMGVMAALMPIWAIGIPFCLGYLTSQVIQKPDQIPALVAIAVFSVLITIPTIAVILAAIFEDDVVLVSKEGLAFPLRMLGRLGLRRARHWPDLCAATITLNPQYGDSSPKAISFSPSPSPSPSQPKGSLNLFFHSGGAASIKIDKLTPTDLEQLLLAIEIWGGNCQRAPELIQFQTQFQNETRGIETLSYTQMWEEELSRRFASTSFVPLEPGHELKGGQLKVVRQLAFGGLSAIYLAQERQRGMVVLKEAVIPANADDSARAKALELFEREARFLVKLDHPQIARVHDHFQEGGRNYLLLDYIRGQDLRQLVKQNGAQTQERVLEWGCQIADIIEYLHKQSPPIIHRDLTPDNLVLGNDGKIILIDFGAANEFVGTATGTLVGKQAYIAPEQLRGKASTQSDIYAFGGTLFFLLTGNDPEALSASHPKEVKPEIALELDRLVSACTELEAEQRPAGASDLAKQIQELSKKLAGDDTKGLISDSAASTNEAPTPVPIEPAVETVDYPASQTPHPATSLSRSTHDPMEENTV